MRCPLCLKQMKADIEKNRYVCENPKCKHVIKWFNGKVKDEHTSR